MTIDLGPSGILAKVTSISDEGNSVYFDLRNGKTGSLNNVDQEYLIGDVLLITGDIDNNRVEIEKVPSSTWPDNLWVGIVKIKLPDISVIDSGARFRAVPTVTTPFYSTRVETRFWPEMYKESQEFFPKGPSNTSTFLRSTTRLLIDSDWSIQTRMT